MIKSTLSSSKDLYFSEQSTSVTLAYLVTTSIEATLLESPQPRFVILDFSHLSGLDYSALESFSAIKTILFAKDIHLLLSGVGIIKDDLQRAGVVENLSNGTGADDNLFHIFKNLNESIEWCENYLLFKYYNNVTPSTPQTVPITVSQGSSNIISPTPRYDQIARATSLVTKEYPDARGSDSDANQPFGPVNLLMQAFSDLEPADREMLEFFGVEFVCVHVAPDFKLYSVGDLADSMYIVESGELNLLLNDRSSTVVETLLPGTMVGSLELFSNRPRNCSLVAAREAVVWKLCKASFDKLAEQNPKMALQFLAKIAIPFDNVRYHNTVHHLSHLQ